MRILNNSNENIFILSTIKSIYLHETDVNSNEFFKQQ